MFESVSVDFYFCTIFDIIIHWCAQIGGGGGSIFEEKKIFENQPPVPPNIKEILS